MNMLRFHLIDTDAWSYYVPGLPAISNTSAYSPLHVYYPSDLAELVAWGRDRGIVVYPEVDFPFHSAVRRWRALAVTMEFKCLHYFFYSLRVNLPVAEYSGVYPRNGLPDAPTQRVPAVYRPLVHGAVAYDGQDLLRAQWRLPTRVPFP